MGSRPEIIQKFILYLQEKEPLIYLFLINSDFILDEEGEVLRGQDFVGVLYREGRILFYYKEKLFKEFSIEELYFIIIHEAYHVMKRHVHMHELFGEDHMLAKSSQDAIINHEINETKFTETFKPKDPGGIQIPQDFKYEFYKLGDDAYSSIRLFHWFKAKQKENKMQVLLHSEYIKDTENDKIGIPLYQIGYEFIRYKEKDNYSNDIDQTIDNLIPIITANGESFPSDEFDSINELRFTDSHLMNEIEIEEDFGKENFVRKMVDKAETLTKNAGKEKGSDLLKNIKKLLEPQVDWKTELNRDLNLFISNNKRSKDYVKSILTYLWNPRSRYGMLSKAKMKKIINLESIIILAIDTSGSCFYSEDEKKKFFTEIDAIAEEFEFNNKGRIYTLSWDYLVQDDFKEYHSGDWETMELKGGGGTNPICVFEHMDKALQPINGNYALMNLNKEPIFFTENKQNLPLLIFLTDGYFFYKIQEKDLKVYEKSKENILFFTRKDDMILDNEIERIIYK